MASSDALVGFEGFAYFNSATYGSPTWVAMPNVKDCKVPLSKDEADVSIRGGGGWKAVRGALKGTSIDFGMQYRKSSGALPADVQKMLDAWLNDDIVDMLFLDGPEGTVGSQGLRAWMEVLKFERDEPLNGAMVANVSVAPGLAANPPEWYEET